jgi:hypothetical protein
MSAPLTPFEKRLLDGLIGLGERYDRFERWLESTSFPAVILVGLVTGLLIGYWASL